MKLPPNLILPQLTPTDLELLADLRSRQPARSANLTRSEGLLAREIAANHPTQ